MEPPILSIAIPTYNRVQLLRQTVELLLPQLREGVELIVCDNASSDGTADYLKTLQPTLRHFRHPQNLGPDANFLSGITESKGKYVWLLCDDDLPCSNAVEKILAVINECGNPGLISLRPQWTDIRVGDYDSTPVITGWVAKDKNEFIADVGEMLTFGSIIVVRRDCVDLEFIRQQFGSSLVPAAVALQAAGSTNRVMMSEKPLLFARGGNAGGYDAYAVFSKNLRHLLKLGRQFGYQHEALDKVYRSALSGVILYIIRVWPVRKIGLWNLFRYSVGFREFYTKVLPALGRLLWHKMRRAPVNLTGRLLFKILRRYVCDPANQAYPEISLLLDRAAQATFQTQVVDLGANLSVRHPFHLYNPKYIKIGDSFCAGHGFRLEAWDEYAGEHFSPVIKIGNRVGVGFNVHIGAIDRIEIHDNVLIGSHVLITDHTHGGQSREDMALHPIDRPLRTKGAVVIEEDVWIGEGACILPGVRIGKGAIIGANAVVTSDVPARSVAGGVPARVLRPADHAVALPIKRT